MRHLLSYPRTKCQGRRKLWKSEGARSTAQWSVLIISSPLGVGQAPVENSWGTHKTKNVAQKKLVQNGTFRLIPYLHKNWSLSTLNLPIQNMSSKSEFFGKYKNEDINFKNEMSCIKKFYSFQLFVDFSTDLESPDIKFGFRFLNLLTENF